MQTIKDLNFHLVGFMLFTLALRKEIRPFEKGNLIIKLVFKRGKLSFKFNMGLIQIQSDGPFTPTL